VQVYGTAPQRRQVIRDSSAVGEARRESQRIADAAGLSKTDVGRAGVVATELANNLLNHAGGGELLLQAISPGSMELIALDRGRGMADVQKCMRDGFSTSSTPGTGLGAVKRLSTEFDIHSEVDRGTAVMSRIGAALKACFGAICTPIEGELECGDTWRLAHRKDGTALAVIDGLGHGPLAARAAEKAAEVFQEEPFMGPRAQMERMHKMLGGTRGAAGASAQVQGKELLYAGIGNIAGRLCDHENSRGLVSHSGTLGFQAPRVQQFEYPPQKAALLIMHSDGISARWDLKDKHGLSNHHPAIVAAVIYRDHSRGRDDATIVVIRL
jgi:anti-sigma regulatory factor (Ser/Thr protein kinase)